MIGRITTIGVALAVAGGTSAGTAARLEGGWYRLEVTLEIPNVLRPLPYGAVERCIRPAADGTFLVIVTDPPLAACPSVRRGIEGDRLSVDLVCPRANGGRASASYELGKAAFTGRIEITAGGKNMRFTELQRAVRVGGCP